MITKYLDIFAGNLTVVSLGASPITAAEAKRHCRVDTTDEDLDFARWIESANAFAIAKLHRALINSTFDYTLDAFPPDDWGILLPRPPLSSVTSITYTDQNGTTGQAFSSANYVVSTDREPGRITLANGESWPSTYVEADVIVIRYVAGYGASGSDVPEEFRDDMLRHVWAMYHRVSPELMKELKGELFNTNPLLLLA
jgi:uncharacterized phiE125 gp8 family phage protein